jgi:hypothetical protein
MTFRCFSLSFATIVLILTLGGTTAQAGTISLAWDPVVHDDLAGYRVYYGTSSANLDQTQDVGLSTSTTLTGLIDCTTYYIAVKAVDSVGGESADLSNVVSGWARPVVDSASPVDVQQGSGAQITISGTNFQSGAVVNLSNASVAVNGVTVNSCSQLVVDISVDPGAPLGPVDVEVVNPDQVFGSGSALFNVIVDSSGPTISAVNDSGVGSTTATITWTTDEPSDSQVFFREAGESAYQQTAVDTVLVTSHSVALTGLTPGTTYEYYVRSADAEGNATTATGNGFTTSTNSYTYLRVEAESTNITAPLQSGSGADAFNGGWVSLAPGTPTGRPNNPSGTWDYGFHVPSTDTWYVWFRIDGRAASEDGWLAEIDGAGMDYVDSTNSGDWEWSSAGSYSLDVGLHTLTLGGYEATAGLDRILITDDPDFLPTEQAGSDVTSPSAVSALGAVGSDGAVTLTWTNPSDGDLSRVIVRYRTDGRPPINHLDGWPLLDRAASPGAGESLTHTGLTNGVTYFYSVFALDDADNVSQPASAQATPEQPTEPVGTVENLRRTDVKGF